MTTTHSNAARNVATDAITALLGASGRLKYRIAGTVSSPGAAAANLALSATPFAASGAVGPLGAGSQPATVGVAYANAITSDTNCAGNAAAVATATLETSGGTIVIHCDVAAQVTTSVTGPSGAPTITVGSNTGLAVGMTASGTGIAAGARIVNINATTITLSVNNSGAVSGTGTFGGDINMSNNLVVNLGDTVSLTSLSYAALGG